MSTEPVSMLLPTTVVGSYVQPAWLVKSFRLQVSLHESREETGSYRWLSASTA